MTILGADPLALLIMKSPNEMGFDVAYGSV